MHRTGQPASGAAATTAPPPKPATRPNPDEVITYSVKDAAAVIGLSERRMWDWVLKGKIYSFIDGGRRFVPRQALRDWVDEHMDATTPTPERDAGEGSDG